MPIMEFLSNYDPQDSESRFLTGIHLNALMLYPTDWQLRQEWIVFRTIEWEQIKARRMKGSPVAAITGDSKIDNWLSRLTDMQRRHITPETRKLTHIGIIAGRRLYYVAGLATHFNGGSFNRADELIPYKKIKDAGGKIISTAKGSIHPAWKKFHSVAHLWTAEWVTNSLYPDLTNLPEHYPEKLIPISEWFRQFGETYIPDKTHTPILNPEDTWKSPEDFRFKEFDGVDFLGNDIFMDFTPEMLSKL